MEECVTKTSITICSLIMNTFLGGLNFKWHPVMMLQSTPIAWSSNLKRQIFRDRPLSTEE